VKLSTIVYVTGGYVLGARAGRERYDQIVRLARRVAGSQRVQATAGVVQGQLDQLAHHARQALAGKTSGSTSSTSQSADTGLNGYHH
jgi:hypothetical protein